MNKAYYDICDLKINHNNSVILIIQVIAAEGEQKAARALKEAAEVISSSSAALQLRYLQTVSVCVYHLIRLFHICLINITQSKCVIQCLKAMIFCSNITIKVKFPHVCLISYDQRVSLIIIMVTLIQSKHFLQLKFSEFLHCSPPDFRLPSPLCKNLQVRLK